MNRMRSVKTHRNNRYLGQAVLSLLLLILVKPLWAGSEEETSIWENFELNGYLENENSFRLHSPNHFSKIQNLLQLEVQGQPKDWLELYMLTWAMYDAAYDIYPDDYPDPVREEYRTNFSGKGVFDQVFRELYAQIFMDNVSLKLGRQQVVWGEAIGLRITDVVNPQDFREFILDDFIDSRIPLWMAKAELYKDDWTLELLWIPFFEPDRPALPGSEWEWTFDRIRSPPGVTVVEKTPDTPADSLENSELGGRILGLLGGWDLAASYLYGWDRRSARHTRFDPRTFTLTVEPRFHRAHVFGLTLANAFGPFVPRAEISYHIGKYFNTLDRTDPDGVVKKPYLYYMVGTDYKISDYLFNLQFIQKVTRDYSEQIFEDEVQNNVSLWVQAKFFHETLRPEILILYSANDGSWLIRPKVAYELTDHVITTVGSDIITGSPKDFFGQFDSNDRIYVEIKYSF